MNLSFSSNSYLEDFFKNQVWRVPFLVLKTQNVIENYIQKYEKSFKFMLFSISVCKKIKWNDIYRFILKAKLILEAAKRPRGWACKPSHSTRKPKNMGTKNLLFPIRKQKNFFDPFKNFLYKFWPKIRNLRIKVGQTPRITFWKNNFFLQA